VSATARVRRLEVRCRVPARHPDAAALRLRLDGIARERLPLELGRQLDLLPGAGSDEVVVVRRLALCLRLGRGRLSDASLGEAWSRGLAAGVARGLAADTWGGAIRRYPSRTDYLAAYVEEVVTGGGRRPWYHHALPDATLLGPGAAIREALLGDPERIAPVLAVLHRRGRLAPLLATLAERDAWTLFNAIPAAPEAATGTALPTATAAATVAWSAPGNRALALVAEAAAGAAGLSRPGLESIRGAALAAPARLGSGRAAAPAEGDRVSAVRGRSWPAPPDVEARRSDGARNHEDPLREEPLPGAGAMVTAHAGVFLLLPDLVEVDVPGLLHGVGLTPGRVAAVTPTARWLVLLKCLGPARDWAVHDPAVALAAGLEAPAGRRDLRRLATATRAVAPTLAAAIASAATTAGVVAPPTAAGPPAAAAAPAGVPAPSTAAGTPPAIRPVPAAAGPAPARGDATVQAQPDPFRTWRLMPRRDTDLIWSRVAALVLRRFAARLVGFGASSPGFLQRNFLAGAAAVEVGPEGVFVEYPRAPLQMVLRVTGALAGDHRVPWLPGGRLRFGDPPEA
jgi:hypothetical protein